MLATYTLARGLAEVAGGHAHQEKSLIGLLLTIFASFGMPFIGYFKYKTGRQLGSKGLAAEAKESIACSFDSWTTLAAMAGGLLGAPGLARSGPVAPHGPLVPAGRARSRPGAGPCALKKRFVICDW